MRTIFTLVFSVLVLSISAQNFTWTEQSSGTTESLNDIHFVDNMTGWAVGNNGTILSTVDGGEIWTTQTSSATTKLRSVFFLSDTLGWIAGGEINLILLKTVDGGANWVPIGNDIPEAFLNGVEFADEMHGFAITSTDVYYTSNGGANWEKGTFYSNMSNVAVYDLSVISDTSAFLCGRYRSTTTSQTRPGVFDNIVNSAGEWVHHGAGDFTTGDELRAIHFTDNQKGFVGGTNGKVYTMEADGNIFPNVWYFNFDTDNGTIWSIDFADNNHGMFNTAIDENGTTTALIYHTADAGESWSSAPDSIPDLLLATLSAGDTDNAWIAGSGGRIFKGTPKDITSIEKRGALEFKVLPNPFSSSIMIKSEEAYKDVQLNIFNYTGQLVESVYLGDFHYSFELVGLDRLESGVYFLQMKSADGRLNSTQKVVKH